MSTGWEIGAKARRSLRLLLDEAHRFSHDEFVGYVARAIELCTDADDVLQQGEQEPVRGREMGIWQAALTLANNICVQESDRHNADDASGEADATNQCAKRIREFIDADDTVIAELLAEAGVSDHRPPVGMPPGLVAVERSQIEALMIQIACLPDDAMGTQYSDFRPPRPARDEVIDVLRGMLAAPPCPGVVPLPPHHVTVPKEPSDEHLMSMALRYDHGIGLRAENERAAAIRSMRQLYEEATGQGFYALDGSNAEQYRRLIEAQGAAEQGGSDG